ncbi:MAG TPA: energy transducer TonB [Rhizomicrobium sp.]|jgi:protein TonB|nr:energy transducer TonB [Rhizomicrobium sp.]
MEQPAHDLRAHAPTAAAVSSRGVVTIAIVGLLHVGLIWAIIAGLASGLIQKIPQELVAEVVKPKDEVKPPPPPPPDLAKPPPPFVPPPELNIASDAPVTNAIVAVQPNVATPPPVVQAAAPVVTPSKAVGRTHDCASYFPDLSRRLNESGNVLIHYDVGVDGSISNVGISKSSGSERLDNAAVSCVSSRWRNTPAMQGETAVASPNHQAIIQFTLH